MLGVPDDGDLSLQQIENEDWGDPPPDSTRLIATALQLRREPVGLLDTEALRLLIGQKIGLDVLVPRALALLDEDPLAEGDYFPGDLLVSVLAVPATYWRANNAQLVMLERVIASVPDLTADLRRDIAAFRAAVGD
jgi:hypothetical protein